MFAGEDGPYQAARGVTPWATGRQVWGPPFPEHRQKQLPNTLKYAYVDEKKIYLVIISANLSEHEEERLLKVLRKH